MSLTSCTQDSNCSVNGVELATKTRPSVFAIPAAGLLIVIIFALKTSEGWALELLFRRNYVAKIRFMGSPEDKVQPLCKARPGQRCCEALLALGLIL